MWQEAPGLRVVPWQSWTPPNWPAPPPAPFMTTGAPETLVMVTVCWAEVVFTGTSPKSRAVGVMRKVAGAVAWTGALTPVARIPAVTSAAEISLRACRRPIIQFPPRAEPYARPAVGGIMGGP